jgi:acetoin:2,6-dichlorophenolindophenol oxidoreductase subunit alpha
MSAALDLYRTMVEIRCFEEVVRDLYERGQVPGIVHLSIGQEAVATGICSALAVTDYITSTHRGHGHCLAKGADPEQMFAELLGRQSGYCKGLGGSMHIANRSVGNLGANAIVGGSVAIAAGAALAARNRGSGAVAVCFIGDGAANQGLLFEAMNFAAVSSLPVIYVCEDNVYAEYTRGSAMTAGSLEARAAAMEIPSRRADGMIVSEVAAAGEEAVARARAGNGPTFLVFETYRFHGHGLSDRARSYRTRAEEEQWLQRDPILQAGRRLVGAGECTEADLQQIGLDVAEAMNAAAERAADDEVLPVDALAEYVYAR